MRAILIATVVTALCASMAHANFVRGVNHDLSNVLRKAERAAGFGDVQGATPLCGTPSTATVSLTFASQGQCEAYATDRIVGGRVGESWTNCSAATICIGFTNSIAGSAAGFAVVGVSMYNIGTGSIAFNTNATAAAALTSYSQSFLPATPHQTSLAFVGDCDNTFGSLTLQQYPTPVSGVQSFNFASCS
jgi:hypothetical protein